MVISILYDGNEPLWQADVTSSQIQYTLLDIYEHFRTL